LKGEEEFLEPIYINYFKDIILVVITTISDDSEKIRKISLKINDVLLAAFPLMKKEDKRLD
jgi:hypothetical protein